jgi:hypothetical protein
VYLIEMFPRFSAGECCGPRAEFAGVIAVIGRGNSVRAPKHIRGEPAAHSAFPLERRGFTPVAP